MSREHCPICGAQAPAALCPVVLAGPEPVYTLAECTQCGTRFLDPLPATGDLNRFYAPRYYGSDWFKQEGKGLAFGRSMLPADTKGKFLDLGCSLGHFLGGVRRSSQWDVYGVEVSPEAAAFAREKLGLNVRCGELSTAAFPDGYFDYIHVCNVLEHVREPRRLMKECRRILQTGGHVCLSVPNGPVDSANLIRYYKSEGGPARSKDGHLFFFSRDALGRLFQDAGFVIASSRTFGIRRGLRALGWYPRKPSWKSQYRPSDRAQAQSAIHLPPRKKRLPGYYAYRFHQARLKMLPGLWSFGLDFEILLGTDDTKPLE